MERIREMDHEGLGQIELIDLSAFLKESLPREYPDLNARQIEDLIRNNSAALLIIRKGVDILLGRGVADAMLQQQDELPYDTKGNAMGRIVNKVARHTIVFGPKEFARKSRIQEDEKGKQRFVNTIVGFDTERIPLLTELRNRLHELFPLREKGSKGDVVLMAEGNHYYDLSVAQHTKTYIVWHGDTERKIVICARIGRGRGRSQPLAYQWYDQTGRLIGQPIKVFIRHGDIYVMSEKATGWDWKKKSKDLYLHLEHAAGEAVVDSPTNRSEKRVAARGKRKSRTGKSETRDEECSMFMSQNLSDLESFNVKGDPEYRRLSNKCVCEPFRRSDAEPTTQKRLNPLT